MSQGNVRSIARGSATRSRVAAIVITAAMLSSTAATAATSQASAPDRQGVEAVDAQGFTQNVKNGEKVGFMEKYFPFSLPDNLEPEVEENVTTIWLLSALLLPLWSPLWAPAVVTGEGFPADFVIDMLISDILHILPQFIPVLGCVVGVANCFYLCPVATIAIYDRNLKAERRERGQAGLYAPPKPEALAFGGGAPAMAY